MMASDCDSVVTAATILAQLKEVVAFNKHQKESKRSSHIVIFRETSHKYLTELL